MRHLLCVVGHALLEAVEKGVVLEEEEVPVVVEIALPGVVAELVDRLQRVGHLGHHGHEGLHPGVDPEAELQELGHRHRHVQEGLEKTADILMHFKHIQAYHTQLGTLNPTDSVPLQ